VHSHSSRWRHSCSAARHGLRSPRICLCSITSSSRTVGRHANRVCRGQGRRGGSITAAYAAQALVAIPTVAATAYFWLKDARFELRASALIISTLLVQPYFMYYDLAWLAIPIVFLMRDAKVAKLSRLEWVLIGAAWLLPVEVFFVVTFEFPLRRANKLDLFVRVRFPT
jgi:hypothetical protein